MYGQILQTESTSYDPYGMYRCVGFDRLHIRSQPVFQKSFSFFKKSDFFQMLRISAVYIYAVIRFSGKVSVF